MPLTRVEETQNRPLSPIFIARPQELSETADSTPTETQRRCFPVHTVV